MNDKELLELAAKAAGIKDGHWMGDGSYWVGAYDGGHEWNPLTDDGDALRLVVALRQTVSSNDMVSRVISEIVVAEDHHDGTDPYAATRRVIVRAAAEIGKEMNVSDYAYAERVSEAALEQAQPRISELESIAGARFDKLEKLTAKNAALAAQAVKCCELLKREG